MQLVAIYRIAGHGETAVELPRLCRRVAASFTNRWSEIDPHALAIEAAGCVFTDPVGDSYDEPTSNDWLLDHPDIPMMGHLYNLATMVPEVWIRVT